MARTKGKSLCIFSAKGGVGKSITALNIAGILAKENNRVLIIDFDTTAGSIATYLNTPFEKTIYNFVDDYINNRYEHINNYVTKYQDNIFFISSCKDPRQGSKIEANAIEIVLEKAMYEYDYIIVDTNHVLNEFNITILDRVDEILLIVSNDLLDLKNMRNLITIFKSAAKPNYKVLLNNALNPYKKYYSLYDIKSMIRHNIDYYLDNTFFIKSMDQYIADGKIITMNPKMAKMYPKAYKSFLAIAEELKEKSNEK